jgi:hypothetical protein
MKQHAAPITFQIEKILEFDDLFPGEKMDVRQTLLHYSREKLLKIVGVFNNRFLGVRFLDHEIPFFSGVSRNHIPEINRRFEAYTKKVGKTNPTYCTTRTILELLRTIYSISVTEYKDNKSDKNIEYDLFKVLLKLNQDLMDFNKDCDDLGSMIFFLNYVLNDSSNISEIDSMNNQLFYLSKLYEFLQEKESERILEDLLATLEIERLSDYCKTILSVFYLICRPDLSGADREGYIAFTKEDIARNNRFLYPNLVDNLSINWDDQIKYERNDNQQDNNTDYRCFRAHPLIRLSDGSYMVYSTILLTERLFNSLYFDMQKSTRVLPKGLKIDFTNWYNKEFIEHRLFQRLALSIVRKRSKYYPSKEDINSEEPISEEKSAPDFYLRENEAAFLFECKSIKLNGALKDRANLDDLLSNLKLKLYTSDKNIDPARKRKKKSEPVGITQLARHLKAIDNGCFYWDGYIPERYTFYPVIVVDDWKLAQCGMSYILNKWYFQLLKTEDLMDEGIKPLIIISIETLYFYACKFRRYGIKFIFEKYYRESGFRFNLDTQEWTNPVLADFNL